MQHHIRNSFVPCNFKLNLKGAAATTALAALSSIFTVSAHAQISDNASTSEQDTISEESVQDTVVVLGRSFLSDSTTSATKLNQRIAETPQSIAVLDAAIFEDLGVPDYINALRYVPGVQIVSDWENFPQIQARGFGLGGANSFRINGAAMSDRKPLDNIAVERLEFIRGAAGTTYGEGSPGGFINIITRQPGEEFSADGSLEYGSFNRARLEASVEGALDQSGKLKALVSGAVYGGDSFVDRVENEGYAFLGALSYAPTDQLSFDLTYYRNEDETSPLHDGWPGVALEGGGFRFPDEVPIETYVGAPWTADELEFEFFSAKAEYNFSDELNVAVLYGTSESTNPQILADACCEVIETDGQLLTELYYLNNQFDASTDNYELRAFGEFSFLENAKISYLATYEHKDRQVFEGFSTDDILDDSFDLLNPGFDYPDLDFPLIFLENSDLDQDSFSFTSVIEATEKLTLTFGVRYDDFTLSTSSIELDETAATVEDEVTDDFPSDNTAYRASIMYEVLPDVRAYYSYGETFEINASIACGNEALPPETGEIHEIGVKAELNDKLLLSAAAYDITTQGNPLFIPGSECPTAATDLNSVAIPGNGQESQGFEIDLIGNITPAWNIIVGYAYTDAVTFQDDNTALRNASVPEHSASLFTTYDFFDGPLQGFGIGGGFSYLGERDGTEESVASDRIVFDEQFRANAAMYYRANDWLTLQLNIDNITDEENPISQLETVEFQNMYLAPRTFTFRASVKY